MGFNFPNTPASGETYTPVGGPTFVWDGVAWKSASQGVPTTVYVGSVPPASPTLGQMWWNSDTGNLFIWYQDTDSSQWVQVNGTPAAAGSVRHQTLDVGSGNYAKPAGLKSLKVTAIAGGGGSSQCVLTAAGVGATAGNGGGGGACIKTYQADELGASTPYTVGAGGTGGTTSVVAGNPGGDTTFAGMTASGGAGATSGSTAAAITYVGGFSGGGASGGDINLRGGQSDVNTVGTVGSSRAIRGSGGTSLLVNAYGQGLCSVAAAAVAAGLAGLFPGGGAVGAMHGPSVTTNSAGTKGGDGVIYLEEYF